ncbi:sel1 repeat family protein [Pelomyxa schiedti]|nr:sel1 repeat family protein [Pelomyxa schiedti]
MPTIVHHDPDGTQVPRRAYHQACKMRRECVISLKSCERDPGEDIYQATVDVTSPSPRLRNQGIIELTADIPDLPQKRPPKCTVVGYEAYERVLAERSSFFKRLAESALRADLPNAPASVVVASNFRLVRKIANGNNGIVYEVKCIGEGHPEFFRDQSYVLKVPFNYRDACTSSVSNAYENEYLVSSTLDPHPNVNQYFCHFTDRPPQEYYDLLPDIPKELAFDPVRKRFRACVWIVLEYHSETLDHFLNNLTTAQPLTATPWCIVHKYSRDICAGLVHLFTRQTVHFDIKLDNIVVSANKEQAIVIDLGCAKKFPDDSLERETGCFVGTVGNQLHLGPEIINGIARYTQYPNRCRSLLCDKQPSFELGCILFELAMCGQHPLPGYPSTYGPTGQISFSFDSAEHFPMRPPAFPREFCDLVRSLLQCDPAKRMPLLEASKVLETLPEPSPQDLLSFYTFFGPVTNDDSGTLTVKGLCQILAGSPTKDCVGTLHKALDLEPLFSPALLLLYYLHSSAEQQEGLATLERATRKEICAVILGKASFTYTDLELVRAVNQHHRTSLPELVLSALRLRYIDRVRSDDNSNALNNCMNLLRGKITTSVNFTMPASPPSCDRTLVSIFLKNIFEACSEDFEKRRWSEQLTVHTCERSKLMLNALFQFEEGNIVTAIHLVSDAFKQFESCRSRNIFRSRDASPEHIQVQELCYLPGLLFLYGLCFFADDHVALCQLIPPNLACAFSRAVSSTPLAMRVYCKSVLLIANCVEEKGEVVSIAEEWDALVASVSALGDDHSPERLQSWACVYFVTLRRAFCLEKPELGPPEAPTTHSRSSFMMSLAGACFRYGIGGVGPDKALLLLQKAADDGNANAMNNLGVCYQNGQGVGKDINQAVSLYKKAADAGNATAMFNLGVCYENGRGVDKDINQAVSLFKKAADAGDATAMKCLGVCYANGRGVDKDINQAVSLYRKAADAGNAIAMKCLGVCYENGWGVDKDINQAVSLYKKAADAGDATAMTCLGVCYANGWGVYKDINQAASLFKKAADAGDANAMTCLGVCYENGWGVHRDIGMAKAHYHRAASAGCDRAIERLRNLGCSSQDHTTSL